MSTFVEVPANKKSKYMRKAVYSVGMNDAEYQVFPRIDGKQTMCPVYKVWNKMLERCYSLKYQARQPTYKGCSVAPEWHRFSVFREWMLLQDYEGRELDKDILIIGNKVYSPDTCCFISTAVNSLLTDSAAARGEHPLGVNWCKREKRYLAKCNIGGKQKYLGCYSTPEEASLTYRKFKANHIRTVANGLPTKVRLGLYRHALALYDHIQNYYGNSHNVRSSVYGRC